MTIYEVIKKQIKLNNMKEGLILLLKLVVIIIIAHEIYYAICRFSCLVSSRSNSANYIVMTYILIGIVYLLYRLGKRFKKRGVLGRAVIVFIIISTLTCWLNSSIWGIYYFKGPYWGRVIDADTGEPISGANVMAHWKFESIFIIFANYSYADARETITDDKGRFILPSARRVWLWPFSSLYLENLYVYKPGYDSHPPNMYQGWTEEEKEKWKEKLIKKKPNYNYDSDVIGNYDGTFSVDPRDVTPYKATIIRLNKALSKEEQINAKTIIPFDDIDCDDCKIKKIEEALGRRRAR